MGRRPTIPTPILQLWQYIDPSIKEQPLTFFFESFITSLYHRVTNYTENNSNCSFFILYICFYFYSILTFLYFKHDFFFLFSLYLSLSLSFLSLYLPISQPVSLCHPLTLSLPPGLLLSFLRPSLPTFPLIRSLLLSTSLLSLGVTRLPQEDNVLPRKLGFALNVLVRSSQWKAICVEARTSAIPGGLFGAARSEAPRRWQTSGVGNSYRHSKEVWMPRLLVFMVSNPLWKGVRVSIFSFSLLPENGYLVSCYADFTDFLRVVFP